MTDDPARGQWIENSFRLTPDQEHRAARVVASASTDAADCAMLLAVLGLHAADSPTVDDQAS